VPGDAKVRLVNMRAIEPVPSRKASQRVSEAPQEPAEDDPPLGDRARRRSDGLLAALRSDLCRIVYVNFRERLPSRYFGE